MTHSDFDRLARAERLAQRMDNALRIPFTRLTFGWDSVIGLVPVLGDTLSLIPALRILQLSAQCGVPRRLIARMAGNAGLDWVIGLLPLIGDVFDIGYKANLRNAALLRAHVEATRRLAGDADAPQRPLAMTGQGDALATRSA